MFKKKLPADEGSIADQVYGQFEKNDKKADKKEGGPKEGSKNEEALDRKEMAVGGKKAPPFTKKK